jgi:hypothetical protein
MSQNSRNQAFSYYFCLMIEESGSRRPKNVWIRLIRTRNTGWQGWPLPLRARSVAAPTVTKGRGARSVAAHTVTKAGGGGARSVAARSVTKARDYLVLRDAGDILEPSQRVSLASC